MDVDVDEEEHQTRQTLYSIESQGYPYSTIQIHSHLVYPTLLYSTPIPIPRPRLDSIPSSVRELGKEERRGEQSTEKDDGQAAEEKRRGEKKAKPHGLGRR